MDSNEMGLWAEVEALLGDQKAKRRALNALRQDYERNKKPFGNALLRLEAGSDARKAAIRFILTHVEYIVTEAQRQILEEQLREYEKLIGLALHATLGYMPENWRLDPEKGEILAETGNKEDDTGAPIPKKPAAKSFKTTVENYVELINVAMSNPCASRKIAKDDDLPPWLKNLANHLSRHETPNGLRRKIECAMMHSEYAQRWYDVVKTSPNAKPYIKQMTKFLAARTGWMDDAESGGEGSEK